MAGARKVGPSQYVWDESYKKDSELVDELWDEVIDYQRALVEIRLESKNIRQARKIATEVLEKHGKVETE